MKAAILQEFKKPLVLEEVPRPELEAHEILIQVEAAASVTPICIWPMEIGRNLLPLSRNP